MRPAPRRSFLRLLLVALLLLTAGAAFLRTQFAWDSACSQARKRLPELLGMEVSIGRCEIDPIAQTVTLHEVSATPKGEPAPLFAADKVVVAIPTLQPFFRRISFDSLQVSQPRVRLDLSRPGAPGPTPGRCPLDALRHVEVAHLDVKGAKVEVLLPEGRRVEVDGLDLGWRLRHGVDDFHLEATRGLLGLGEASRDLSLTELSFEGGFDPSGQSVELTRGELALEDVDILLSGKLEQLCAPTLELDTQLFLPLRTLARATGLREPSQGQLWAHLSVSGKPQAPRLNGELVGQGLSIAHYRPGDFRARVSLEGKTLKLSPFTTSFGPGSAKVTASIQLSPGLPTRARVELDGAEFGQILARAGVAGSWVDFFAHGRVNLSGKLAPLQLSGDADLQLKGFSLASRAFDQPKAPGRHILSFADGQLKTQVAFLPDRVTLSPAEVRVGQNHLKTEATLYFDFQQGLEIHTVADAIDLDALHDVAGLSWAGKGSARASIAGPYNKVVIDGEMHLRDFKFWDYALGVAEGRVSYRDRVLDFPAVSGQKGHTEYFGSASLDFHGREPATEAKVSVPAGRVEDLVDVIAGLSPNFQVLQGPLTGAAAGTIEIHGPASRFGGRGDFAVKDTRYYGRRVGDGKLAFEFRDGKSMVLLPSTLVGPLGVSEAEGTFFFAGPLDYRFKIDPLSLAEVVGPDQARALGLSGTLTLVGNVKGDREVPLVSAYLTSPRISLADRSLGAAHLEARFEGRKGQVWGNPFGEATLASSFTWREPYPYQATVHLTLPEIRPLLPPALAARGLYGELKGVVQAKGYLFLPKSANAHATFDRLALARGDLRLANDGPVVLDLAAGRLSVGSCSLAGDGNALSLSGWAEANAEDLKLDGTLDLKLLESLLPQLELSSGHVQLSASATGSPRRPSLVGSADVSDLHLRLRDQPIEVSGMNGRVDFSEAKVLLEDLEGTMNEGRLAVHGELGLEGLSPSRVQLEAELDQVVMRPLEDLPVTTTGELVLSGKPGTLALAGDLELTHLLYDRPLAFDFLSGLRKKSGLNAFGEPQKPWLTLDVGLHLRDARVANNVARARLLGDVRLTGTNVKPGLVGTLETAEGSAAFFRGNEFHISQGLVEFKDRNGLDGVFDVHAESQVRDYLVRLHAYGRTTDPRILLSSDPELPEGDILSLLTLGVISKDKTNTAGTSAGLAAEALFNASGLDRQVRRFLPKNSVLRDLSFHIATSYNDATGIVEPTALLESKFLTERLKLTMSQPVSGRGTRAEAEYQVTNRLSAQAQWDNEHSDFAFGNLGLDLTLRWDVE